jgi:hypothetical protein
MRRAMLILALLAQPPAPPMLHCPGKTATCLRPMIGSDQGRTVNSGDYLDDNVTCMLQNATKCVVLST